MAESIGLIERAAALLRQREAAAGASPAPLAPTAGLGAPGPATPVAGLSAPASEDVPEINGAELIFDRSQLASLGVAVPTAERSLTAEEFRLIKRNLITAWTTADRTGEARFSRIIMVTSARPGEGKTFVALNLALAFSSEREVKALLVDADTHFGAHRSGLKAILGSREGKGIVDVLAGTANLEDALIRTNIENLLVLAAGRGGPQVPELFSSSRMSVLLHEMTRRFPDRFIIIDTPPCMVSSDAATMAPLVGQIVFVVEAYRTQHDEIEASLSMLAACPRISLVLNKSEQANAHFGSYTYGYRYHYSSDDSDQLRRDRPAPA
ncbi:MAG TPA: polysaccharide biosynthesis tyrosine autokinase [Stellaceae bacterium]|nr:polysaccharide biosynthesis tyrosine autokinase [Stellaceae bacterium]